MFSKPVARTGLALVLPAAAVAVVVAGCGSSGTTSAGTSDTTTAAAPTSTSVPATVTDTVVPPATTTTATAGAPTASGPVACATANLAVTLGTPEGTAGSEVYPLHFTNKASAACTITAYPGVSFVAPGNGSQVGVAAVRSTGVSTPPTITLSSGAEATSQVMVADYQNFPASACASTAISGFRIYPPDNKAAAYVAIPGATKACTKASQLQVQPVVAGAGS